MKPVLFTIGAYNSYAFGFFLALSFLFSTFVIWKLGKEEFKEEEYLDLYLYMGIFGLICARIFYIATHFDEFGFNILRFILVRETPGLSLLAGVLGAFVFVFWQTRLKKENTLHVLDIFSIAASIALFFVKIGQHLGGASFGKETSFILGLQVIGLPGRRHPVELYEAFFLFLISIILIIIYRKASRKKVDGAAFFVFVFGLLIIVFALEFFKTVTLYWYGLSLRQLVTVVFLILLVASFVFKFIKTIVRKKIKKL